MHAHYDKVMFQETYTDTEKRLTYFNYKIKHSNQHCTFQFLKAKYQIANETEIFNLILK